MVNNPVGLTFAEARARPGRREGARQILLKSLKGNMMRTRCNGLTLTELLVVVCVVLILLSVIVVGAGGIHTYAQRLNCQHRMEQIWQACLMYANASRGVLPCSWDAQQSRPWYQTLYDLGYIDNIAATSCPLYDLESGAGSGQAVVVGGQDIMTEEMSDSVSLALDNLAETQNPDGSWTNAQVSPSYPNPVGTTGLALAAFIGLGVTETSHPGTWSPRVTMAIDWIMNNANTHNGEPFGVSASNMDYTQGILVTALSDAYRAGITRVQPLLQSGFDYLCDRQDNTTYGGFGYLTGVDPDLEASWEPNGASRQNDVSASAWGYQGLVWAREAGLVPTPSVSSWDKINALTERFLITSIVADVYYCPNCGGYVHGRDCTTGPGSMLTCPRGHTFDPTVTKVADDYRSTYCFTPNGAGWNHYPGYVSPDWRASPETMSIVDLTCRLLWGHTPTQDNSPRTYDNGENAYNQLAFVTAPVSYLDKTVDPWVAVTTGKHIKWAKGMGIPTRETAYYDVYATYYLTLAMWKLGGSQWEEWKEVFPPAVSSWQDTTSTDPNVLGSWHRSMVSYQCYGHGGPDVSTALAALALEACGNSSIGNSKYHSVVESTAGTHSYGYNKLISSDTRTMYRKPAADTVILMDYLRDAIDADTDTPDDIAPRHGGKANVLFADGRVKAMTIDELVDPATDKIKAGMITLEPGD